MNGAPQNGAPQNGDAPNANRPPRNGDNPGGPQPNARPRSGYELDPFFGKDDLRKPLRSRLLAVPSLRAKYLEHVKQIAAKDLNWKVLGPFIAQQRLLIEAEVQADTRKLTSFAGFQRATSDEIEPPPAPKAPAAGAAPAPDAAQPPPPGNRGPNQGSRSLRTFADRRSAFLLNYREGAPQDAAAPRAAAQQSPERAQ
jgi:hypothetical protein